MSEERPVESAVVLSRPFWQMIVGERPHTVQHPGFRLAEISLDGVSFWACNRSAQPRYPHQLDNTAILAALRDRGCKRIVTTAVCGALCADYEVPSLAVVSDFIDCHRLRHEAEEAYLPAEVDFQDFTAPYSPALLAAMRSAVAGAPVKTYDSANYLGVDGPRYETPAEVRMFRSFGADLIGMTAARDAIACRYLGLDLATLAIAANYAAGVSEEVVSNPAIQARAESVAEVVADILVETIRRVEH